MLKFKQVYLLSFVSQQGPMMLIAVAETVPYKSSAVQLILLLLYTVVKLSCCKCDNFFNKLKKQQQDFANYQTFKHLLCQGEKVPKIQHVI